MHTSVDLDLHPASGRSKLSQSRATELVAGLRPGAGLFQYGPRDPASNGR